MLHGHLHTFQKLISWEYSCFTMLLVSALQQSESAICTHIPSLFVISCVFSGGSEGKASARNAGDLGLIPGLGRSPEVGNGSPLQYSYLGNSMDREAWQPTVHGVPKSQTQLSMHTQHKLHGRQDLSFPSRDRIHGPCTESAES